VNARIDQKETHWASGEMDVPLRGEALDVHGDVLHVRKVVEALERRRVGLRTRRRHVGGGRDSVR
jgi:hypothetical protein